MARILLVDDDGQYRAAIKNVLGPGGHQISEASDGLEAQAILNVNNFDLIISDIRMPKCDGIQLLKWVKAQHKIPVILITGFAEVLETVEASDLGADGFLPKPFKLADIQQIIGDIEAGKPTRSDAEKPNFCRVPLEDFVTGSRIHFNVYHRITDTKYVKIAHRGEDIADSRMASYRSKGLRNLYLSKEDFARYVGFNLELAKRLPGAKNIPAERKRNFLRYTSELVLERVFIEGANREEFDSAKEFLETTLEILQENDETFALIETLNAHADHIYAHSLGAGLYGIMIARALNWHWSPTLFKISMGGLLHDVGFKEIPRQVLEKPRVSQSQEERSLFETHATRGMELLNNIDGVSEDVILIAYQHHEDCAGGGYPQNLKRQQMHPLARLISLTDALCDLTIARPGSRKRTVREAVELLSKRESCFDKEYFAAMKQAFNSNLQ